MTTPKNNVVRPGQRKPYVKATRRQIGRRRGFVAGMQARLISGDGQKA